MLKMIKELFGDLDGLIQGFLLLGIALVLYILFTFVFDMEARADVYIDVDKTAQEMTVMVDGVEEYTWPVSTGKAGYDTPVGDYGLNGMHKIWNSKQWDNAPMPHAIFFTKKGHAIHGTNEVENLGNPASHGCVRLSQENAETLYYLVSEHGEEATRVALSGAIEIPVAEAPEAEWAVPDLPSVPEWVPDTLDEAIRAAELAARKAYKLLEQQRRREPYVPFYGPPIAPPRVYIAPPRPRYNRRAERRRWKRERRERRRWRRGYGY
jgi:hypothetical protein